MRPWLKHWIDWVRTDVLHSPGTRPRSQAVFVRYEKAGAAVYDAPAPWNADAVVVEVLIRVPPSARRKADFVFRVPGGGSTPAEVLRPEADDRHRLLFRLPVPPASTAGEVLWKARLLANVTIRVVTADEFLGGLSLHYPTATVRLGPGSVAARTFVPAQARGLIAGAVLRSASPLAPLADVGVCVRFAADDGPSIDVPVPLTAAQLAGREAVLTAVCPKLPRRAGGRTVSWLVGGRVMAAERLTGIPARRFELSLRVCDVRFAVADKAGVVRAVRQLPAASEVDRVGPVFLLASSEPGAAGVCRLSIHLTVPGGVKPPPLAEQDVLVTDGPTVFAPGLVARADLDGATGFEVRHGRRVLGAASLSPVPAATLTAEGGFKPPPEFAWGSAADDELAERLARLMNPGDRIG